MFSIAEIIQLAVTIERNGEKIYREAVSKASDPGVKALLAWLADEEAEHVRLFTEAAERVETAPEDERLEALGTSMLTSIVAGRGFSLDDTDLTEIEGVKDLLSVALEFEHDTVIFYRMLESFIEDPHTLATLRLILAEEQRHVERLRRFIDTGTTTFPPPNVPGTLNP